jgi:hypothetical protein
VSRRMIIHRDDRAALCNQRKRRTKSLSAILQFINQSCSLYLLIQDKRKNNMFFYTTPYSQESNILDSRLKHSGMTCFNFYLLYPPAKSTVVDFSSASLTLEKYGGKTRRAKCPTRKLSEFTLVNEFFLVNDASRGFTHIFRQS